MHVSLDIDVFARLHLIHFEGRNPKLRPRDLYIDENVLCFERTQMPSRSGEGGGRAGHLFFSDPLSPQQNELAAQLRSNGVHTLCFSYLLGISALQEHERLMGLGVFYKQHLNLRAPRLCRRVRSFPQIRSLDNPVLDSTSKYAENPPG